jgi:hypothetical protein
MVYSDDMKLNEVECKNLLRVHNLPDIQEGSLLRIVHVKAQSHKDPVKDGLILSDEVYEIDNVGSSHLVGILQPEGSSDHPYSIPIRRIMSIQDPNTGRMLYANRLKPSEALREM